jgi:nitroimidazol reductase NimA-like FMN-containing flavoprotein (pyridoxamine 5'-phosphate oxidase superfamily)
MRCAEKEITDSSILDEIMVNSQICRLGLVEYGEAYIVPVNYVFKDGVIFMHSACEGRKIEILKRNPIVTFEIEYGSETVKGNVPCKWGTKYRSVMGKGTVEIHYDAETKQECFDMLMRKFGADFVPTYDETSFAKAVALKLRVDFCTGKESGPW